MQALAEEGMPGPVKVTVVTNGAAQVKGERLPYPEKALVLGPVRVAGKELPGVTLSALDVVLPEGAPDRLAELVLEEALAEGAAVAALRGERRYEAGVKAVSLPEARMEMPQGAHVLVTGGFGGIGLTIAEDLIRRHGVRITLVARRPLPERGLWKAYLMRHDPADPVARRILALQRLEALGGEVLVAQADVANPVEMAAARDAGVARFGPVHAVIHAAGVVADGPLMTKAPGTVDEVLAPKVLGTQVLDGLFPDGSVALMVLFASTSTATGPAGQVDYVAANEYLNAFARSRAGGKTRVVALNWGIWQGVGMAAKAWPTGWAPRRRRGCRSGGRCWTRPLSTGRGTGCSWRNTAMTAGCWTGTGRRTARR